MVLFINMNRLRTINSLLLTCMLAAFAMSGCEMGKDRRVLAHVNNEPVITVEDFNYRISRLPSRYREFVKKNKKQFLDEVVVDTLLYQEALKQGLDKDKDVKAVIQEAARKILIARLLQDEVDRNVAIEEADIENYYKANPDQFTQPEVVRASHVLLETSKEARDVLNELSKGADFKELARTRSIDPASKEIGGDIGYFTKGQLVPEIEEAAFSMNVGDVSDVISTKFGYHVIKLTERREPRVKELREVRGAIEQALNRIKKKMLFNEYAQSLKDKAKITVNAELLQSISEEEAPASGSETSTEDTTDQ